MKGYLFDKSKIIKGVIYLTAGLYVSFLYLDIFTKDLGNKYSMILKYSLIVLCFLLTLLIGRDCISRSDKYLVQLARFFTLIADYYLVLTDNFKMGVLFFCFVQTTYIIRHTIRSKKPYRNASAVLTLIIMAMLLSKWISIPYIDKSIVNLALIYASLLMSSLFCAVSTLRYGNYKRSVGYLIAIGMLLFFFCDLNVGLFNLINNGNMKFLIGFLMWFFYAPSQLLLSLSGFSEDFTKILRK